MKICFFADASNVHLGNVAPRLAERGHEVCVVCHKPAAWPGVTVERFGVPAPGLTRPFRWSVRWAKYLRGFLRRFDCVVLLFLHDWGFTPGIIAGGCLIAFPQGSDIVDPPGETPPSEALIEKRVSLLRHARAVAVTCDRFGPPVAEFAGIDLDRIDRLPLGVDLTAFAPRRVRPTGAPRVGFVKGFREVYGATYLVQAMPLILAAHPTARFDMVGDGPQREVCRAMAANLGVMDAITWHGRQAHDRMPELIGACHVTVIPSLCESFGVAAIESQAMEVPVVASNVGGLPDAICDGETGVLVEPRSPEAIARAVSGLLSDVPRCARMGRTAREWVTGRYDWPTALDRWDRTLQRAFDRDRVLV